MDRHEEIRKTYFSKHRRDKGRIRTRVSERCQFTTASFDLRMNGKMYIAEDEEPIFLEELNLPLIPV